MKGRTISHYVLLEMLGRGGMGAIYKARDVKLDRIVAMKFLAPGLDLDPRQKARFVQEAKAASSLGHVNICTIHEFGETDEDELFIVMEYCEGGSLRNKLQAGRIPIVEAIQIAGQTARGLSKAHSSGIVHRDIKPENVLLTSEGVAKIADFGLAKLPGVRLGTSAGTAVGTTSYMSPEQVLGRPVDHRSDIWSWGVLAYEMLAGQRPFLGESQLSIAEAIVKQQPAPLRALRPEIPEVLEGIVNRALQKVPDERWANAEQVLRALSSMSSPSQLEPASAGSAASIAVLPFTNLSAKADREYFSDGLTEELIYALSRLPNLRVVSRTSAFEFKDRPQNIRKIGEELQVSNVLEGSVRRAGKQLRVSVRLVNVADGYCLWSQRFDREIQDIFAIQDEIAQSIAGMLNVKLAHGAAAFGKRQTPNVEAYESYLRGRFHWNKRSGGGFQLALENFQAALRHDPNYAPAYSGIADYHAGAASWGLERPSEAWPKAKEAAEQALAIDPTLAEAHASMGTIRMWYEWDWAQAEREFLRAIELNPGEPKAHVQYNLLLVQTGRSKEAERQVRIALSNDPLSVPVNLYLAGVFHYRRDYERSLEQCRKALELDPNDIESHIVLGLNFEQQRLYEDALRALLRARELSGNNPLICGPLASCYTALGQQERTMELLGEVDRAARHAYVAPMTWVMIYAGLGDKDQAFQWLERAAEMHDVLLCYVGVNPIYDFIRDDSRYVALLQRLGLGRLAVPVLPTATFSDGRLEKTTDTSGRRMKKSARGSLRKS